MQKFCNFFLCEFYTQKFTKNVQKFLLKRLNAVNFFRFSQVLVEVKNANNEICIISDNSSNMAAIGLKFVQNNLRANAFEYLILDLIWVGGRFYMEIRLGPLRYVFLKVLSISYY